jgi:hypothetical protein
LLQLVLAEAGAHSSLPSTRMSAASAGVRSVRYGTGYLWRPAAGRGAVYAAAAVVMVNADART